ncbi:MAG: hypothetical protein KDC28_08785, partial [Saprospiraceae bacterium]|nr:hypothetical protein [Saprospiraceae bacterium]
MEKDDKKATTPEPIQTNQPGTRTRKVSQGDVTDGTTPSEKRSHSINDRVTSRISKEASELISLAEQNGTTAEQTVREYLKSFSKEEQLMILKQLQV